MRQSHLILSNALIIWVSRILLLVPQLVLVPYLIGTIGDTGYGVYVLVWSLMMSIDLLGNSLQEGVVKYSAGLLAQGRMCEVNGIVSSSFVCSIGLGALACACILVVAPTYGGQFGSSLVIMGVMVLFIVPLIPYTAVIESLQRPYVSSIAEACSRYISLAAVILWFRLMTPSVEALVIIMTGMLFLSRLAQVPVAYRFIPSLRNRLGLFDRGSFRLIVVFAAGMVLVSLCLAANATGVRWLMNTLVSPGFVAHLAIMIMPASLLTQLIGAMTITVMPATSGYEATQDRRMLKELLLRGTRYTTILVLSGVLFAALLMRDVLRVWVGPDYVFLAPYALTLFAGTAFWECTSISHHVLKGVGKLRAVVSIYLTGLVIVPLGVIVTIYEIWHAPYIAATVGLAAGYVVCGCLQAGICAQAMHIDFREVLMRSFAQPLMIAVPVYLSAFGLVTMGGIHGLVGRSVVAILVIVLFFSGCYALIATEAERRQVKELLQSAKSKMAPVSN